MSLREGGHGGVGIKSRRAVKESERRRSQFAANIWSETGRLQLCEWTMGTY